MQYRFAGRFDAKGSGRVLFVRERSSEGSWAAEVCPGNPSGLQPCKFLCLIDSDTAARRIITINDG